MLLEDVRTEFGLVGEEDYHGKSMLVFSFAFRL